MHNWRQRHAKGKVTVVRYADNFVIGFPRGVRRPKVFGRVAGAVCQVWPGIAPGEDTADEFGRYAEERRTRRGADPPETFDFLGFTHIGGKTRLGDFTIHRKTSRKKFRASPTNWRNCFGGCTPTSLRSVRGCKACFVAGASITLCPAITRACGSSVTRSKRCGSVLRRRSQRGRRLTWAMFSALSRRWLPTPKILHPYPNVRFASQHPR